MLLLLGDADDRRLDLSSFHSHDALRTTNWDSLEKALTVFVPPAPPGTRRTHRRVDLIFAQPQTYWTAVVGWYAPQRIPHLPPFSQLTRFLPQDRVDDVRARFAVVGKKEVRASSPFSESIFAYS